MSDSNQIPSEGTAEKESPTPALPLESGQPPVPTFGCIVYFTAESGQFHGRVANLAKIEATALSQRELLGQIVKKFKAEVSAAFAEGRTPDWIDPPAKKLEGETKLFLPVHL